MKTIFFQGTFDLLNYGHCRALELAKKNGNFLIVGLNTDELIRWFKKREPILPFKHRKFILSSIKWVDKIIPTDRPAAIYYLRKFKPDVYVVSVDWKESQKEAIAFMKKQGKKVVVSPDFDGVIRSSEIRKRLFNEFHK